MTSDDPSNVPPEEPGPGASPEGGAPAGPPEAGSTTAGPLQRLSLRTKALVIANEYTHRQMEPSDLRAVLAALAPSAEEQRQVARSVDEELRAGRYPVGEIMRLMGELVPKDAPGPLASGSAGARQGAGPQAAPDDPNVLVTRKLRSPHLMPFEKFEFQAPAPAGGSASAADPGTAPPTREMPAARLPDQGEVDPAASSGPPADPTCRAAPGTQEAPAARTPAGEKEFKFVAGGETSERSSAAEKPSPAPDGKQVVLVADDDARARVIYRSKLESLGFEVIEAKDGVEAWKSIKGGEVHCAVMDMKMPGYHGLEVIGRMVDANVILPLVVVSAFDQLANEFVVATYPKLTFLTKPAGPDEVAGAVAAFLRPEKPAG